MYKQHAIVDDDDLQNISSVIDMELESRNDEAIIAPFQSQDVDFEENEIRVGFRMSEIAATATLQRYLSILNGNQYMNQCQLARTKLERLYHQLATPWTRLHSTIH